MRDAGFVHFRNDDLRSFFFGYHRHQHPDGTSTEYHCGFAGFQFGHSDVVAGYGEWFNECRQFKVGFVAQFVQGKGWDIPVLLAWHRESRCR